MISTILSVFKRRPHTVVYIVPRGQSKAGKQLAERRNAMTEQLRAEVASRRELGGVKG
jgi:hypothetical protein